MTHEPTRTCPDCSQPLQPIAIVDRGDLDSQKPLQYRAADAKRGWFTGYPIAGNVEALMCSGCGRILLYGVAGS